MSLNLPGPIWVRGGAGTGKTEMGLRWAAEQAEHASQSRPVLFTTFSNTLPTVFQNLYVQQYGSAEDNMVFLNADKLAHEICEEVHENVEIHQKMLQRAFDEAHRQVVRSSTPLKNANLSLEYLRSEITTVIKGRSIDSLQDYLGLERIGRRVLFDGDHRKQVWELMEAWDERKQDHGTMDFCDRVLRAIQHAHRRRVSGYSAVVVDEAQDFTVAQLQLLQALTKAAGRPNKLMILGDGVHRIYPVDLAQQIKDAGLEVRSHITLTQNFHSTSRILNAARAVNSKYAQHGEEEAPRTARQGLRPVLTRIDGLEAQVEDTARRIYQWTESGRSFSSDDMAVLVHDRNSVLKIIRLLQNAGVRVQPLDDYDGIPNATVKVGTYHRAKGLKFKVVFLPELGWSEFPYPAKEKANKEEAAENREVRVGKMIRAMTRAQDQLIVYYSGLPNEEIYAAKEHFQIV